MNETKLISSTTNPAGNYMGAYHSHEYVICDLDHSQWFTTHCDSGVLVNENEKDVFNYKQLEKVADIILWDSSGFELSLKWNFDWIKPIQSNAAKMIAGNINVDTLKKIFNYADIVDVSGALETNKVKDISKIKNFISSLKKLNNEN